MISIIKFSTILVFLMISFLGNSVQAQGNGQVQVLAGSIEPGELVYYLLPGLQGGDRLYLHMSALSGNLDPLVGLMDIRLDSQALRDEY